ncbi:hypothetical protein PVAP13_9NG473500 [Panicum virgatum]|uniref:DUF4220 domain-containing protein n=1 Tax=Panicum virgatum TaxID=38727 RepID=A0A8T0MQY5_PANVG|nr:hypothetical protein PVAP13_9NG473500 [Panicum virgatum]
MADYVATYLLGRLTLLVAVAGNNGTRRQEMALFWTPFLLLHLGGQETITAFSMEDNTLWKRRLLDLASQVTMAVYVVGKQWREYSQLVAPMALMFVCGAVKYSERIWALRAAAVRAPGSSSMASLADLAYDEGGRESDYRHAVLSMYYERLVSISSGDSVFERVMEAAFAELPASLDFFMDVTPSDVSGFTNAYDNIQSYLMDLKSSKNRDGMVYKMAEVQVSLIHDYLYTKFGAVRFQAPRSSWHPTMGAALQWLGSLGLTSVALVLFAMASDGYGRRSDVVISFILLVGAVVIEISSIFIALVSSYWAGTGGVANRLHLHARDWSGKMAQYMFDDASLMEDEDEDEDRPQAAAAVRAAISWMLASIKTTTTPDVAVSPEVMKLLLDNVLGIATYLRSHNWDFSRFQGQWAQWVADRVEDDDYDRPAYRPAYKSLNASGIKELGFVPSVVVWHLVTSICLLDGDSPAELTNPCKELSNYIMYLVAKCSVMVDSNGHVVIARILRDPEMRSSLHAELHQPEGFISKLREGDKD